MFQTDNQTAIRYVNKLGGTHSRDLCMLSLQLHKSVMSNKIIITAEHLPGILNVEADKLSRLPNRDWSELSRNTFKHIHQETRLQPEIDLFVSRLNTQLPVFMSWKPDPEATAINSLVTQLDQPTMSIPVPLNDFDWQGSNQTSPGQGGYSNLDSAQMAIQAMVACITPTSNTGANTTATNTLPTDRSSGQHTSSHHIQENAHASMCGIRDLLITRGASERSNSII